uniref:Uncharacterized protein n=1 Tax=Avena sativa TaxID=4498 RepID=A0ACD5W3V1_AVESA
MRGRWRSTRGEMRRIRPSSTDSESTIPGRGKSATPDSTTRTSPHSTSTRSDESLILTGPTRGLELLDNIYLEIDLKIKDNNNKDRELSKGLCVIDGVRLGGWNYSHAECVDLESRLSTVEVKFAVVVFSVEATFEIKVLRGNFCGEITACTSAIQDCLVLHDSKAGGVTCDGSGGIIQLWRRVVCVGKETLLLTITTTDSVIRTVEFTPDVNGATEDEFTCGDVKMLVKVNWSLFD